MRKVRGMKMQIDTDKMAQQLIDTVNDKIKNLKTLNIIIIGKSGVGKSTLINTLFRGNFAETGLGRRLHLKSENYPKKIIHCPFMIHQGLSFHMSNRQK